MPSVKMSTSNNTTTGMIRWDGSDWLRGLVPQWGIGTNQVTDAIGFASSEGMDPFRRPGYLYPGVSPSNYTNNSVVDSMLKNGIMNGTNAYMISGGNLLHNVADVTVTTITNNIGSGGIWPHTISAHGGHNTVVGEDVIKYYIGTTPYLFYSWNDNTDGDIGRYDFTTTFDDDYMSTVATGGAVLSNLYPHPKVIGDDNIFYVGNGKDLCAMNGTTGTAVWNTSALDLPSDYIITSFTKTQNFLVIYAYKNAGGSPSTSYLSESTAFFWDYVSSSFTYAYPLLGNYVNGGFTFNGFPGCFVEGQSTGIDATKKSKLLLFNGSEFECITTFTESIPGHGGVVSFGETLMWNSDGQVYQYGTPHIGLDKALNRITKIGGSTSRGMLRNFSNTRLTGSAGTTTAGGCQLLNTGFYGTATATIPIVNFSFPEEQTGKIRAVKIYWFLNNAADCNKISVRLVATRGNNFSSLVIDGSLNTSRQTVPDNLISKYELYDDAGAPFIQFDSLGLIVSYTAGASQSARPAIIEAIEVYFDTKKI